MTGSDPPSEPAAIGHFGLIGDCGTAALVSDRGSIDWLCLPRFDSTPVFARLLDPAGGHCSLAPPEPFRAERRYVEDTAVLATTFSTESGRATVYDFFSAVPRDAKRSSLWPFRYLVRRIVGESGVVPFELEVRPSDAFGSRRYRLRASGRRLSATQAGRALLAVASAPFVAHEGSARARLQVAAGEVAHVAFSFSGRDLGVLPPIGAYAEDAFESTLAYWRDWTGRARVPARMSSLARRSAILLKLLTFAPSGAVIAAPTTSLPEVPGGVRNWDYRYSWVRDASWTIAALNDIGYHDESRAYLFWALDAARLTLPRVHTMYTLHGSHRAPEHEIEGVHGYGGARPVRVGNAAVDQLQLDNWGHIVDAAYTHVRHGGSIDAAQWRALRSFVQFAADNWQRRDQGMWEQRGAPRHHVHSKVMCWVALDRGVRLVRDYGLSGPATTWTAERDRIREAVLCEGIDRVRGNLVRAFGEAGLDAALLLIPATGFLAGDDPRMLRTIERVRDELADGELVRRYDGDDGLPGREGAFVACSFWLAQALALTGQVKEACDVFDRVCRRANDLGLFAEEIDPRSGDFLGNFPQGLSHIALLNAAIAIDRAEQRAGAERQRV